MLAPAQKYFAVARHHEHVHVVIEACLEDGRVELLEHLVGVGVDGRVVQREERDPLVGDVVDERAHGAEASANFRRATEERAQVARVRGFRPVAPGFTTSLGRRAPEPERRALAPSPRESTVAPRWPNRHARGIPPPHAARREEARRGRVGWHGRAARAGGGVGARLRAARDAVSGARTGRCNVCPLCFSSWPCGGSSSPSSRGWQHPLRWLRWWTGRRSSGTTRGSSSRPLLHLSTPQRPSRRSERSIRRSASTSRDTPY